MLPIVDKPLIQYAVEEAAAAGITDMIFITGRNKRAIEDHFDKAYELETELALRNKTALLEAVQAATPPGINCIYIRQTEALGLGHAVLCAAPVVNDEPFAVLLADDLIDARGAGDQADGRRGAARENASVIAVMDVPAGGHRQLRHRRSGARAGRQADRPHRAHRRKAKPGSATVDASGGGPLRAVVEHLPSPAHDAAGRRRRDPADRRHRAAARGGDACCRIAFEGRRYDCGSKLGYLEATVDYGLKHARGRATGFAEVPGRTHAAVTLNELRYIVAVAQERSFGRAAAKCFVEPAGVVGGDPEAGGGARRAAVRARQERGHDHAGRRAHRRAGAESARGNGTHPRDRAGRAQPAGRRRCSLGRHLHGRSVSAARPDPGAARRSRRRCRSTSRRT